MTDSPSRSRIAPAPDSAALFVTCLVDQFRPSVGHAVVDVLEQRGIDVTVPLDQTCCGQPAFNSGFRDEARQVAGRFLDVFEKADDGANRPIVCPSGSCTAMVRNYYPVLFRDDPAQLERAKKLASRLWEFTEFLVDELEDPGTDRATDPSPSEGEPGNATYHRCCHALRELGVDRQPQKLLSELPGLDLLPLERSEVCCGFGGAFSVKMADISTAMLDEKLDYVEATGAHTLVAGDTGCIMHMEGGLRRRGSSVRVLHIAEALAGSLQPGETKSKADQQRARQQ